jgi:DNA-binding transcriptional ArsR family regulator
VNPQKRSAVENVQKNSFSLLSEAAKSGHTDNGLPGAARLSSPWRCPRGLSPRSGKTGRFTGASGVEGENISEPLTPPHNRRILNCMVNDSTEQLTTVFMALADPTRRAILERLAHGEASGTELARPFSISVPAISKHLRVLKNADLILHRKNGRTHMFRLAAGPLRDAAAWLEHYRKFWETQFDSLETYLLDTSEKEQVADDTPGIS